VEKINDRMRFFKLDNAPKSLSNNQSLQSILSDKIEKNE
jgi:hypothetical protein